MKRSLFFILLATLVFGNPNFIIAQKAQDSIPIIASITPRDYEIGGVKVTGIQFADAHAVINVSGLQVGKKIKFPSTEIQKAMKALWKLHLFNDVQIVKEKTIGDVIFFEIQVTERPSMTTFSYKGAKKNEQDALNAIVIRFIPKNTIVTESNRANVLEGISKYYIEKGFLDAVVIATEDKDDNKINGVKLIFDIDKNARIKIKNISFEGNSVVSTKKLQKKMDKTRQKWTLLSTSKLIPHEYEADKKKILTYYNTLGYRDAKIVSDTILRTKKNDVTIHIKIDEGHRYYFRNITWKGNTIYKTEDLADALSIQKGDVYNPNLLEQRLRFSPNGQDISALYMDNGYLFFNIDPLETAIEGDSIDLEMRIFEGAQATINTLKIKGNSRTNEHVIRRELHTLPSQTFNRADIIRSQREIINLGFFNQEALGVNTPVNPKRGTVDIEYTVEEKSSDKFEMSAGWNGTGIVGTLGVSFNNFSLRNMFNKDTWSPLPQGDGQSLSLRAQSDGKYYQSYNMSLTEPWLGGKRANSLTVGSSYTKFSSYDSLNRTAGVFQAFASLGRRLKLPDDNFVSTTKIEYQRFNINGYTELFGNLLNGTYNNLNISQTFSRNTISDLVFPKSGSRMSLILSATPPYSLLNDKRYSDLSEGAKFKWIEYYKWRFNAEHFNQIGSKWVLRTAVKMGSLGYYNKNVGYAPFNRFVLGGDGTSGNQGNQIGQDILALRGYKLDDFPNSLNGGATSFAKYTAEMRYPISLNPSATIYGTAWVEGGNTWKKFSDFKPFDVKRAAGVGLRVHLPMFGTLGFDYGIGFDKPNISSKKLTDYGTFNIILGIEPD